MTRNGSRKNRNRRGHTNNFSPIKNNSSISSFDGYSGLGSNKTPEQIAFDLEFENWEHSFNEWQIANRNHPDPEQYRYYERKFLDVRDKLMEKRRLLYSGPRYNKFDQQLSAADAMAQSILSKYSDGPMSSPMMNYNNIGYNPMMNFCDDNYVGRPNVPPLLSMNFRSASYRRPGPDQRRHKNNHNSKNNDRKSKKNSNSNNKNDHQKKKAAQEDEKNSIFYQRLDEIIKEAHEAECPKLIPGSAPKKMRIARNKKRYGKPLTENEMKLMELHEYIKAKREKYFREKDKEAEVQGENAVKSEDQVMAVESAE